MFKSETRFGSNFVTRKAQIQLKVNAIEVPKDLHSGENSSTFIVQAKGPIPKVKLNFFSKNHLKVVDVWQQPSIN